MWRQPRERFANANVLEHDRYEGGLVMVWVGISLKGRKDMYVIANGALTALSAFVRPNAGAILSIGTDFVPLMDHNARPHRARIFGDHLEQENIVRMDWPSCPTDLNLIEHMWNMLQECISTCQIQPRTLEHLAGARIEEWTTFPQNRAAGLIQSMNRRCVSQSVIIARGGHTQFFSEYHQTTNSRRKLYLLFGNTMQFQRHILLKIYHENCLVFSLLKNRITCRGGT